MTEEPGFHLNGISTMAGEDPFKSITRQAPPNDPRIKGLLSRALLDPASLTPQEVQEMAASLVYYLLARSRG